MKDYIVPNSPSEAEYTDRKSVFIASLSPVSSEEDAKAFIEEIKKKYRDARHNVWAYSLPDGSFRYSDDGEPAGTAGAPVYECISKKGITGCVITVTRYFGGILLGTGGLVHAYSTAASAAIAAAGQARIVPYERCLVRCSYAQYGAVTRLCERFGAREQNAGFSECVDASFLLLPEKTENFERELCELASGTLTLCRQGLVPVRVTP